MKNYVKLHANGFVSIVAPEEENKLQAWYNAIGCDLVEFHKGNLPEPYVMICDEEALLREHPVINPVASLLFGAREHGQLIFGNVLIGKDVMTEDGIETHGYEMEEAFEIIETIYKKLVPATA